MILVGEAKTSLEAGQDNQIAPVLTKGWQKKGKNDRLQIKVVRNGDSVDRIKAGSWKSTTRLGDFRHDSQFLP